MFDVQIRWERAAADDLRLWVDLGSMLDENFGDGDFVLLGGEMHRRQTVLGAAVRLGSVFQQLGGHVSVAGLRRQVERREAVLRRETG